ncbi:MAG: hypothetical protein ACFE78_13425, partial [Candidatus Hodarchaeota archaeon]
PSGVYYRNVIKRGYFQWKSVTLIKAGIYTRRGYRGLPVTTAQVTVIIPNKEKVHEIVFDSGRYGYKEFVRNVRQEMFIHLFQIYHKLAKEKIEA